ncbi:hypothetical protein D9757_005824 [Collybiopsis confluens]|uniref:Dolichyl-diphosphooligosaccharide--protein glycosyltransferase subunit 4 n=1 Tax=Collybiopsis confluens TaxID=2823264 RepID=A0A8H5HN79_9AGAR|nr:hypothetical protein D9757_005824 [Collybiopsis confluens]
MSHASHLSVSPTPTHSSTMTHATLYTLANSLGILAMLTVVGYHFVAVNAKHISKDGDDKSS